MADPTQANPKIEPECEKILQDCIEENCLSAKPAPGPSSVNPVPMLSPGQGPQYCPQICYRMQVMKDGGEWQTVWRDCSDGGATQQMPVTQQGIAQAVKMPEVDYAGQANQAQAGQMKPVEQAVPAMQQGILGWLGNLFARTPAMDKSAENGAENS